MIQKRRKLLIGFAIARGEFDAAGQYNARVKAHALRAGYDAGWKKGGGWVTPDSDPMLLPRVRVRGDTTMEEFIRKVTHRPATPGEIAQYEAQRCEPPSAGKAR